MIHADLRHDLKALLILIALADLLVIEDQDGHHEEEDAQEYTNEQESPIHLLQIRIVLAARFQQDRLIELLQRSRERRGKLFILLCGAVSIKCGIPLDGRGVRSISCALRLIQLFDDLHIGDDHEIAVREPCRGEAKIHECIQMVCDLEVLSQHRKRLFFIRRAGSIDQHFARIQRA